MDRVRAARELAAWKCQSSISTLARILTGDDHPGVRMAAASALGEIGGEEARTILVNSVRTIEPPAVRRTCLLALGQLGDPRDLPVFRDAIESSSSYFAAVAAVRLATPTKYFLLPWNPSAENMARYLLEVVAPHVLAGLGVLARRVSVWETDEACATATLVGKPAAPPMPIGSVVIVDRRT